MASSTYRHVPAVDKAARILSVLRSGEALGISEIARRIAASKGTVRDILLTLSAHGLVQRDDAGRFTSDGAAPDLRALARPALDALAREFGETAFLGTVDGDAIVIAAVAEPSTDLHMSAPLGRRVPIDVGAHSKVLLGAERVGFDDEEYLKGVRAAAAPIIDATGRAVATLLVVGFTARVSLAELRRIGRRVAQEAASISARLSARAA